MGHRQVNPPYDGSSPCPMCQQDVRGMAAYLHNAFVRWGEAKMFAKLHDLREYAAPGIVLTVPHPAIEAMLELVRDVVAAIDGMKVEARMITWPPEVRERVMVMHDRFRDVLSALEPLSDSHFDDARHSGSGNGVNILCARRGSRSVGYGTPSSYDYTVDVVSEGGDIVHTVCGTHLRLHDHFKDRLAKDPAFYGRAYCPTCRGNIPFSQFIRK